MPLELLKMSGMLPLAIWPCDGEALMNDAPGRGPGAGAVRACDRHVYISGWNN